MKTITRNTLIIALLMCFAAAFNAGAQQSEDRRKELREYTHKFLRKELQLNRDQENSFFTVYDQMQDELMEVGDDTRKLERKTINNADATDVELEAAARAVFEQKQKEAAIELQYFEKFKNILSKRQLLNLKSAERKLTRWLLNHRIHQK